MISSKWIINQSSNEEVDLIENILGDYNKSMLQYSQKMDFRQLNFNIKKEHGEIVAGINATTCWQMLYIAELYVDENYRGKGLGISLLNKVEKTARDHGSIISYLDSFDFQAKDFYLKHGYEIFGVIEDCPKGHARYFLKKNL